MVVLTSTIRRCLHRCVDVSICVCVVYVCVVCVLCVCCVCVVCVYMYVCLHVHEQKNYVE